MAGTGAGTRREGPDGWWVSATAPGRVNLIGDHTDYMGGLVMPMAIDLCTTVAGRTGGSTIELTSDAEPLPAHIPLPCADPATLSPPWARYVGAVAAELGTTHGLSGAIRSTLPEGVGLSSSAALEVAVAAALGADLGDPVALAETCRRAEQAASGVPCGIMDQLVVAAGVTGHALLIDCAALTYEAVPVPAEAAVWVLHSGESRRLAGSEYAQRRASAEAAEAFVGPLRSASERAVESLEDPLLRRRARHVRSECRRVITFRDALLTGDLRAAGTEMLASHASLRDDFEVSTPELDALVDRLAGTDGVYGARLTGAGFGGCVVALAREDVDLSELGVWARRVEASDGAVRRGLELGPRR